MVQAWTILNLLLADDNLRGTSALRGVIVRLFKYLHPDRVDVLRDKLLCFSSAGNLNDPFEFSPLIKLFDSTDSLKASMAEVFESAIEEQLASLGPMRSMLTPDHIDRLRAMTWETLPATIEKHTPAFRQSINGALHQNIGMLCLSERQDDLLMWAHYANAHEGFVIEFDSATEFFHGRRSENDELRFLRQVIYSDARPQLVVNKAEDMSAFLTKSAHWAYEKEWRMMFALADSTEVKVFGEKQFHLFAYPASAIKSVTLGCRMSGIKREEVLEVLSSDPEFSAVAIYEASPDDSLFRLNISRVEGEEGGRSGMVD